MHIRVGVFSHILTNFSFFFFVFFSSAPFSSQKVSFFFPSRLFAAIGLRSRSCFTGQLPGIGTVFILASLQMCKVQGKVH